MILPCKVPHHHRLRRGVLWERVAKGVALYKVYLGTAIRLLGSGRLNQSGCQIIHGIILNYHEASTT